MIVISALACILLVGMGSVAAGTRYSYQVFINDASRYANGSMADARGSGDAVQQIGCWSNGIAGSAAYNGSCIATNAAGLTRSCSTNDVNVIAAIRSITNESRIYFIWNIDGTCNYVFVENNSWNKPASVSSY